MFPLDVPLKVIDTLGKSGPTAGTGETRKRFHKLLEYENERFHSRKGGSVKSESSEGGAGRDQQQQEVGKG